MTPALGPDSVERFLAVLRSTHPQMHTIYTKGGCFQLFLTLRTIWPQARAWSDFDHVWTEIDGRFYDINGRWAKRPAHVRPMDVRMMARAHRWHRRAFFPPAARQVDMR